ncbi:hypothetical protein CF335_g8008 [Tilletia laevis]|nr:hypothetical protein CF335_g8008 [Tilletia laevis]
MEQASGDKPGAVMSVAREANGKRCALMSEAEQQQQETDGRAGRAQKDEVALSLCSSVYDTTPATQLRRLSSHTSPSISSRATVLPSYVQSCRGREIPPLLPVLPHLTIHLVASDGSSLIRAELSRSRNPSAPDSRFLSEDLPTSRSGDPGQAAFSAIAGSPLAASATIRIGIGGCAGCSGDET